MISTGLVAAIVIVVVDRIVLISRFSLSLLHENRMDLKTLREPSFEAQMFVHPSEDFSHNLLVVLYFLFKEESHFR